jgi:hypothetical protein
MGPFLQKTILTLKNIDWRKIGKNILKFTAPALAVFFGQLALKVDWRAALLVALLTLWGLLADFFSKYSESKKTFVQE